MLKIIIDTGFWISLLDPTDNPKQTQDAERIAEEIENEELIIPFPTLYEFVNSRLSRKDAKIALEQIIKRPNVKMISDASYKKQALENFFLKSKYEYSDVSLVDEILKLIITDPCNKIDYIVSFDSGLINNALSQGIKVV